GLRRPVRGPLSRQVASATSNRAGRVADKPPVMHADVQTDNVTKLSAAIRCQPMHDLFVHRDANVARELPVTEKRASRPMCLDPARRILVDLPSRHPWLDKRAHFVQHGPRRLARWPHQLQFGFALQNDHLALAEAPALTSRSRNSPPASRWERAFAQARMIQNRPLMRPFFRNPS